LGARPLKSTHGHVILRWLSEQPMDDSALRVRANEALGQSMRFHTCDTQDLTLDALIRLLAERGKIVRVGEAWRSDLSKVCADE